MGNSACCEDTRMAENLPSRNIPSNPIQKLQSKEVKDSNRLSIPELPQLSLAIQDHLDTNHPFSKDLPQKPIRRKFGGDVYEGQLDGNGRPTGCGKMYKHDGSLFVGHFEKGVASGKGRFIFPNGAFYDGEMKNNEAETIHGEYYSDDLEYKGGFKSNKFHGQGKEKGKKHYFEGTYDLGRRIKGQFRWDTVPNNDVYEYIYNGSFDENGKFTGKGVLKQIKGTYDGEFKNGQKHGQGEYLFKSKVKYVGEYRNGVKEGSGTIYNDDGTICYSGQWKNGLPNGSGYIVDQKGDKITSTWKDGIDAKIQIA